MGDYPPGQFVIQASGDRTAARLSILKGELLGGSVSGKASVDWAGDLIWDAAFFAHGVDPEPLVPGPAHGRSASGRFGPGHGRLLGRRAGDADLPWRSGSRGLPPTTDTGAFPVAPKPEPDRPPCRVRGQALLGRCHRHRPALASGPGDPRPCRRGDGRDLRMPAPCTLCHRDT